MRLTPIVFGLLFSLGQQAAASLPQLQELIELESYPEAIELGESLMRDHPDKTQISFMTAYAYQQNDQLDEAIELYRQVIEENPDLPEPRNNLAIIYLAQGDYDRASELLVQAINTHSSYATAYDNLSRIYKGIASEAYRRAVNESNDPAKYSHKIELTAINQIQPVNAVLIPLGSEPEPESPAVAIIDVEGHLVEQVKGWARAWSGKDFDSYTGYYDSDYRGNLSSHQAWVDYRRKRVLRPGEISIEVSDIKIDWRGEERVLIDFEQAFDSPNYSDRVLKRLVFSKRDSEWKITEEWVLSVL